MYTMRQRYAFILLIGLGFVFAPLSARATTMEDLARRLDALEAENAVLRQKGARLEALPRGAPAEAVAAAA